MSYMDHSTSFAPAAGIQKLSFDEIDQVTGGKGIARILFMFNQPVAGTIVGLFELGWDAAHNRADY